MRSAHRTSSCGIRRHGATRGGRRRRADGAELRLAAVSL